MPSKTINGGDYIGLNNRDTNQDFYQRYNDEIKQ